MLWGPAAQPQPEAQLLLRGLNAPGMNAEAGIPRTPQGPHAASGSH